MMRVRNRPVSTLAALALVLALVAGACGRGQDPGEGAQEGETTDVTEAPTGPVTPGGSVIYGLEAENSGFDATSDRWAISGLMMANAIYDPLSAYDADGNIQPFLAESFEPSDDFMSWTINLRPNITFHNGEALTGTAVANFLNAIRASLLTGGALRNIESVTADPGNPLAVQVDMLAPWASFPAILVGQAGMVPAPAQLAASQAGDREAASRRPIGTGPFVFEEWIPDSRFVAGRNPDYWWRDGDGVQLPYLDEVEFRPIPDGQTRVASLQTGDINMMQTSNQRTIGDLRDIAAGGDIQLVEDRGENDESFLMFNTSAPPFDDVTARRAVAYATDIDAVIAVTETDPALVTDSAFGKDSPFYYDSDFPTFDPDRARQLVEEYESRTGQPLAFEIGTTSVTENIQVAQLLQELYAAVGMDVNVETAQQDQFVLDAVSGNYQANIWRQFGSIDPDGDYLWWHQDNATGPLALNIARFSNDELSAALDEARASPDPAVRTEAYATVQRIWADQVPYVWFATTVWVVGASPDVRNLGNVDLPGGQRSMPFQSGTHRLTQTWIQS